MKSLDYSYINNLVQSLYDSLSSKVERVHTLKRYQGSGGTEGSHPWKTTGFYANVKPSSRLVLEALLPESSGVCVVRVYLERPVEILFARKAPNNGAGLKDVLEDASRRFLTALPVTGMGTREMRDLHKVLGSLPLSSEQQQLLVAVLNPIPPPFDPDEIPTLEEVRNAPWIERAFQFMQLGDTLAWHRKKKRAALRQYGKAMQLYPGNPRLHWRIGRFYFYGRKRNLVFALHEFRETVRLDPNWSEGYGWCANTLAEMGQEDAAVDLYRRAIGLNPNDPRYYVHLGSCFKNLGRLGEAIEACERESVSSLRTVNFLPASCLRMPTKRMKS